MILKNKKIAYTLAEIMIVLLAISIIFAAFAPLITKRRLTSNASKYAVWSFSDKDAFEAFAVGNDSTSTQEMFFGVSPAAHEVVTSDFAPLSKVVVRSGLILDNNFQRQIQFRFGRTSTTGAGDFAGAWFMGNKNILLGNSTYTTEFSGKYNTSIGYGALGEIRSGNGNTALGYKALTKVSSGKNNVGVGYNAGATITSTDNGVFVGYQAGQKMTGAKNTVIGYNAAAANSGSGTENTYVGALAGYSSTTGSKNVAVGYGALESFKTGSNNIALGAGSLGNLVSGSNNVAIGYNACRFVTGSNKTCIGAYSGPKNVRTSGSDDGQKYYSGSIGTVAKNNLTASNYLGGDSDTVQRTYIGSAPNSNSGYGGDAVLEIHNPETENDGLSEHLSSAITSNTTTVINGNLIVRGRPYFTVGNSLYHFTDFQLKDGNSSVQYAYGMPASSETNYVYYKKCNSSQQSYAFGSCAVSLTTTSDRRLKNIGSKNTDGLDKISQIKVYNYTFKDDKTKSQRVGVIAQQLQKVFPNSVFKGEDGYLRIRWDEMFYAVINSIKELDKKIIALVKKSTNLENKITQLETENAQLTAQVDDLTLRVNKLKNK